MKVASGSVAVHETDCATLREHRFSAEDIRDGGALAAFFALSNRTADMISMRRSDGFYLLGRVPKDR